MVVLLFVVLFEELLSLKRDLILFIDGKVIKFLILVVFRVLDFLVEYGFFMGNNGG